MTLPTDVQQIKQTFIDHYPDENLLPEEIVLKDDGDVVIDRRKKYPRATPIVVGRWKPGTGRDPFSLVSD